MKLAVVSLFALLAVAQARTLDGVDLENLTAYNYLAKIGLPLAEKIRKAEEQGMSRIVGGTVADLGQFPYQVGLLVQFSEGLGICGAVLVSVDCFTTAAHCWWDGVHQGNLTYAVLGSITFFSGGTVFATDKMFVHDHWNPTFISNDIAVGILPSSVEVSSTIAPIALPSDCDQNEIYPGKNAIVSGFGRTSDGPNGTITIDQSLSYAEVPVMSNLVCALSFPIGAVQPSNICTSGAEGRGACNGDSGGPLAVISNGRPVLAGIVSFGSGDGCEAGDPVVYTRVTYYLGFIKKYCCTT